MALRPVEVECYSGGQADERPRRIFIEGQEHVVTRLLRVAVEEGAESRERAKRYTVLTEDRLTLELFRSHLGVWYLVSIHA